MRGLDYYNRTVFEWVTRQGVVEEFIIHELDMKMGDTYKKAKYANFFREAIETINKDVTVDKERIQEIAKKYGVGEDILKYAGLIMQKTERLNRVYAFLSGILMQRKALAPLDLPVDSAFLIENAKKAVNWSQFQYDTPNKPLIAQTPLGQVFNRFKLWGYSSVKFRRMLAEEAIKSGYRKGTTEYDRFQRMMVADMFYLGLALLLPYTMFDYSLPAPYGWLQSLSDWLFGDNKEREHAYFVKSFGLPAEVGPITEVLPPLARVPKALFDNADYVFNFLFGDRVNITATSTMTSIFPFGRMMRDAYKAITSIDKSPEMFLGIPFSRIEKVKERKLKAIDYRDNYYFAFNPN